MVKATILALAALATLAAAGSAPTKVCECVKPQGDTIAEAQKECCAKVNSLASDNECRFDLVSETIFKTCCATYGGYADCQDNESN